MQVEAVVGQRPEAIGEGERERPGEQQPTHDVARQAGDQHGTDGHRRQHEERSHRRELGIAEPTGQCLHDSEEGHPESDGPGTHTASACGRASPACALVPRNAC